MVARRVLRLAESPPAGRHRLFDRRKPDPAESTRRPETATDRCAAVPTGAAREAAGPSAVGPGRHDCHARYAPALPDAALQLLGAWKARAKRTAAHELIFSSVSGKPISPNNVLRRWVWPACQAADLQRATWLTFRRTYSSWAHDKGVPAKLVAQIMGHTKVDTTMNVYTQVLDGAARLAADRVGSELFRVVSDPGWDDDANSLKRLAPQAGLEPATLRLTAGCSAIELLRNTGRSQNGTT